MPRRTHDRPGIFRRDAGATDPILVIAAIAVSLILLIGGSFAVSGLIGNAKDLNAKSDLDKVATSEAAVSASGGPSAAGLPNDPGNGGLLFTGAGGFMNWSITANGTIAGDTDAQGHYLNQTAVGFTPTPGVIIKVAANSTAWVAGAVSTTGTQFWRSSQSSTVYTGSIPAGAYDASLTVPQLVAPPDSVASCPTYDGNSHYIDESNSQSMTMTALNSTTLRFTLKASGTQLCNMAQTLSLKLDGQSGQLPYPTALNIGNAPSSNQQAPTAYPYTYALTTTGTGLAATRTLTIDFQFGQFAPYSNINQWLSDWNNYGGIVSVATDDTHETDIMSKQT